MALYKQLDRDEMNTIGRLYMQWSYSLNNFFRKKSVEYNPFIHQNWNALFYKWAYKDKMNGVGGLYMQLRYPWLNSFVSKNQ